MRYGRAATVNGILVERDEGGATEVARPDQHDGHVDGDGEAHFARSTGSQLA